MQLEVLTYLHDIQSYIELLKIQLPETFLTSKRLFLNKHGYETT
jgi:hypothetical protein